MGIDDLLHEREAEADAVAPPAHEHVEEDFAFLWRNARPAIADAQEQLAVVASHLDGDDGKAYAWLGITRIEPPVVSVSGFKTSNKHRKALGFLARYLKVSAPADLREKLRPYLPEPAALPPRLVTEADRKRLDALIADRIGGFDPGKADSKRGKIVFETHCAACHQIGREGNLLGPQLDGIGSRGAERLAEDVLDPNRNVDSHFYVTSITLNDGTVTAGFLAEERGAILQLIDAAGQTHRIQKSRIRKREISPISLMPAAFGQLIPENDFHNLLSWLLESDSR